MDKKRDLEGLSALVADATSGVGRTAISIILDPEVPL